MPYNDAASRAKASATMKARAADPNDPWLERNRQARLGKPSRGGHVTAHSKGGISKPETCIFCREQEAPGGQPAKALTPEKATVHCNCGCGEATQSAKSLYRPGHDARHAGLVARDLVASRLQGHERQYSEEDLGSDALRAKALKMADRLTAKTQAQAERAAVEGSKWTESELVKRGRWTYPTRTNGNITQVSDKRDGSGNWTAL